MLIKISNKAIEYLFYLLFFLVPLIFLPFNYELFEFNKMIFVYAVSVLIASFWGVKMVVQGKFSIQRTPLDIPILLFFASQLISTILSIDIHTSIWGYYSRFNGGLASIISYILLYYAFVSNMTLKNILKIVEFGISAGFFRLFRLLLISGGLIALFGVLERLGIDKNYWVQDVQNRVFSTLGQPNWLAAYLSILIPISIALVLLAIQNKTKWQIFSVSIDVFLSFLFYLTILFTKSRSGFAGLWVGLLFFATSIYILSTKTKRNMHKYLFALLAGYILATILIGSPFEQLNRLRIPALTNLFSGLYHTTTESSINPQGPALETGGTESGEIRKIVWKGALDIARHYPLFGSGVETFAYSYYQFRPPEHNRTSEWDFLYNKAHNEYLNYLANTGFIGLGTYLLMIGTFVVLSIKYLVLSIKRKIHDTYYIILTTSLLASYISILVSNFFGFSVVVINLYFFLIPAFVLVLNGQLDSNKVLVFSFPESSKKNELGIMKYELWLRWIFLAFIILTSYFMLLYIIRMWVADKDYALGRSLNKSGEFSKAYPLLVSAIQNRPGEPQFSEELSLNTAALSIAAFEQKEATLSAQLVNEAVRQSTYTIKKEPNNPSFWRTRIRVFYTLSQIDDTYNEDALAAAKRASQLAPTDPKVIYNYALLLGQQGKLDEAIKELELAVKLKPDYRDPVYALGLFYHEKATDSKGAIIDQELFNKAIAQMEKVLKISSQDAEARDKLKSWRGY